ncbi:MAG: Lpp/OprI family alanine-zipper lipoprotein [Gammaproteobacteria bacterium]
MASKLAKILGAAAIAGFAVAGSGCAGDMSSMQAKVDEAMNAAAAAQSAAANAASAAASAQSTADAALEAANGAQACCNANSDKIDRMFQRSMTK